MEDATEPAGPARRRHDGAVTPIAAVTAGTADAADAAGTAPAAAWRGFAVLAALMLAAFTFSTVENLPIGLLDLIAGSLRVSVPAVGLLVTGYGVTVAAASLPLAHAARAVPRRHVLAGLLAVLVASSLLASLATSYHVLLSARLATRWPRRCSGP